MAFPEQHAGNFVDFNFNGVWTNFSTAVVKGTSISHLIEAKDISVEPAHVLDGLQVRLAIHDDITGTLVNNGTQRTTDVNGKATVQTGTTMIVPGKKYRLYATFLYQDGLQYAFDNNYKLFTAK